MGTYIPKSLEKVAYQLNEISFTDKFKESVTALAVEAALKMDVENIYVVGYDGYQGDITPQELELFNENEYIFKKLKEVSGLIPISITPTTYSELSHQSVFALI
jgi:4-hydroxy 2-oxovalerate aldolase